MYRIVIIKGTEIPQTYQVYGLIVFKNFSLLNLINIV